MLGFEILITLRTHHFIAIFGVSHGTGYRREQSLGTESLKEPGLPQTLTDRCGGSS